MGNQKLIVTALKQSWLSFKYDGFFDQAFSNNYFRFCIAKNTLIMKSIHLKGIVRESSFLIFQVPNFLQQRFHEIQRHWKNNGIRFIRSNFC